MADQKAAVSRIEFLGRFVEDCCNSKPQTAAENVEKEIKSQTPF